MIYRNSAGTGGSYEESLNYVLVQQIAALALLHCFVESFQLEVQHDHTPKDTREGHPRRPPKDTSRPERPALAPTCPWVSLRPLDLESVIAFSRHRPCPSATQPPKDTLHETPEGHLET